MLSSTKNIIRSQFSIIVLAIICLLLTGCYHKILEQPLPPTKTTIESIPRKTEMTTQSLPASSSIENKPATTRNLSNIFADEELAHLATMLLREEKQLYQKTHIRVFSLNQTLILLGEAPTQELKDLAEASIQTLKNIKAIKNKITVSPPISTTTKSMDSWITAKLKTLLLTEKNIRSTNIKVITEHNVVYLMGLVSYQESQQAIKIAKKITNEDNVVSLFEITPSLRTDTKKDPAENS